MISKKTLKNFEFKGMVEYYDYIVNSQINGNHQQVKDLFKSLSNTQKKEFFNYLGRYEQGYFNIGGLY